VLAHIRVLGACSMTEGFCEHAKKCARCIGTRMVCIGGLGRWQAGGGKVKQTNSMYEYVR
jgi:hypothetical protein